MSQNHTINQLIQSVGQSTVGGGTNTAASGNRQASDTTPAYSVEADIEAMARGIAAYIYQTQGLETMCYSGVENYVDRESHCYLGEAEAALSASPVHAELARVKAECERLRDVLHRCNCWITSIDDSYEDSKLFNDVWQALQEQSK